MGRLRLMGTLAIVAVSLVAEPDLAGALEPPPPTTFFPGQAYAFEIGATEVHAGGELPISGYCRFRGSGADVVLDVFLIDSSGAHGILVGVDAATGAFPPSVTIPATTPPGSYGVSWLCIAGGDQAFPENALTYPLFVLEALAPPTTEPPPTTVPPNRSKKPKQRSKPAVASRAGVNYAG